MPANLVELSVTIQAPPAEVWRVIVQPDSAPKWLGGFRMVSTWQVGARLVIQGRLNDDEYAETGEILACEPPRLLRFSHWSPLWRTADVAGHRAVMTWTLEPDGPATTLSLRHELPDVEALAQHAAFFWRGGLLRLQGLFGGETTGGQDPDAPSSP